MQVDETHDKILKLIETNPKMSQREVAIKLGISLGKANYCLKALIEKGIVKTINFRDSQNKIAYVYKPTPSGIEEKEKITMLFLKHKMNQYEKIKFEIEQLQKDITTQKINTDERD